MKKLSALWTPKFQNRLLAAGSSLVIAFLILLLLAGGQRQEAFYSFFIQPLATVSGWRRILGAATVNVLVALGVCVMFHGRQYSLISEGAFLGGACTATWLLLSSGDRPAGFSIALALLAATLVGGIIALPSALLVTKRNVNVTMSSVIVDFVVLELTSYILEHFLSDPSLATGSFAIPLELRLPYLYQPLGIRVGTLLALLFAFGAYMVLYRTRTGYTIRMVGASPKTAAHLGLSAGAVIVFSQLVGGALAGLGGAVQMMGVSTRYSWAGEFSNVGFFAILVALLADCHPGWIPATALLFGYLSTGGSFLQTATNLPSQVAGVSQAGCLLLLLAISYYRRAGKLPFARVTAAQKVPEKEGGSNGNG